MAHRLVQLAALSAGILVWPGAAQAGTYTWQTGNYSGASGTYIYGLNDSGQAVGFYQLTSDNTYHGLVVTNGHGSVLQYPSAMNTQLFGINNSGVIVGSWDSGGLIYQSGNFTPMPSRVRSIANNGLMLIGSQLYNGSIYTPLPAHPGANSTAYRSINSSGAAAGFYLDGSNNEYAFVYSGGTFSTPPCVAGQSSSFAINDQGTVVQLDNNSGINYLYSGGQCTALPFPPGANYMQVLALNNPGAIAGIYFLPDDNTTYAFIGTPVVSVPAVSVWGIAMLAILLAATAMLFVARNHGRTAA